MHGHQEKDWDLSQILFPIVGQSRGTTDEKFIISIAKEQEMNVKDGMLCWNPGTEMVKVFPWPDTFGLSREYRRTALACYPSVRKFDFEQRKSQAFIEAIHLIVRDKCDPLAVHNALMELDEYRAGCAEDMPGMRRTQAA